MIAERHLRASHPLNLTVQVLYGRRRFCSASVRSLSVKGMSISLRNLTLPAGTLVELEVDVPGLDWRGQAVVARSVGAEVNVLFREPQPELLKALARPEVCGGSRGEIGVPSPPLNRPQLARH